MRTREINLPKIEGAPIVTIKIAWWFWPYVWMRLQFAKITGRLLEEPEMERIFSKATRVIARG